MKKVALVIAMLLALFLGRSAQAHDSFAYAHLCQKSAEYATTSYFCTKLEKGWEENWTKEEIEILMRINRTNVFHAGFVIAMPRMLDEVAVNDFSPFDSTAASRGEPYLVFDPNKFAWALYDAGGTLLRWGPAAGGSDWCQDVERACRTIVGEFRILYKKGTDYRSSRYPIGCDNTSPDPKNLCAPMPYALFFDYRGYAFHGSNGVEGQNGSHGCVRVFTKDAKWLNERLPTGTLVVIKPYEEADA